MGIYAKRLAAMQENFETAQDGYKEGYGADSVPAGVYVFKVSRIELGEASTGNLFLFRDLTVTEGEQKGQTVQPNFAIESDFGLKQCLVFFEQMGYEIEGIKATDIEVIASEIANDEPEFKGRLRYSKKSGFPNVTVMEVYTTDEGIKDDVVEDEGIKDDVVEDDVVEDDDDVVERLRKFCTIRGIEVHDDDDKETIEEILKEYEFKSKELDDDEIQLFNDAGFSEMIEDEEPPPPPAKKKGVTKKAGESKKKTTNSRVRKKK